MTQSFMYLGILKKKVLIPSRDASASGQMNLPGTVRAAGKKRKLPLSMPF